jgi:hypothetical protein
MLGPEDIRQLLPTMDWDMEGFSDTELELAIEEWWQLTQHMLFYLQSLRDHHKMREQNR